MKRREALFSTAAIVAGGAALLGKAQDAEAQSQSQSQLKDDKGKRGFTPVTFPNGATLPFKMVDGVKEFHLIAEPVKREFAPGMVVNCWGYNGMTPGPAIECFEGDRVRVFVTNKLPERTAVHWHGVFLPNGMDGVGGLTQPHILPGETYVYEFTLKQSGTLMYHPHSDEMTQMAMGMQGFFIVHPKGGEKPKIDRDFAIMLMEWSIPPGAYTPNPNVMVDFNIFTFNSRVWPGTAPLIVKLGDRVRVRFGNLSMDNHPIHLHGFRFQETGTDGGKIPPSARRWETTVDVPVGSTRDIEFVADEPGDWIFHCHKSHHTMNPMAHDIPNMMGVKLGEKPSDGPSPEERVKKLLPDYMPMGEKGMGGMEMGAPENTLPMMSGKGPYGGIEMGGMFTIVKVREDLKNYDDDPGFYKPPPGTSARKVTLG
jgi:FtsP/CotA-like multicopper oxidase with cupredoxin domain